MARKQLGTAASSVNDAVTKEYVDVELVSDFDPRLDDTRIPVDGSVTAAKLNPSLGSLGSSNFQTGTNWIINANSSANNLEKKTVFGTLHYANDEEPVCGLNVLSNSSASVARLGGGSSATNASMQVEFWTAADTVTPTGTRIGRANQAGWYFGDTNALSSAIYIQADNATPKSVQFLTGPLPRWLVRSDNNSESGADAGSNFQIVSCDDAGSVKSVVLEVNRASGVTTLSGLLDTAAATTTTAGLRLPHGTAPTSPVNGDVWTTTAGAFVRVNGTTAQLTTAGDIAIDGGLQLSSGESTIPRLMVHTTGVVSTSQYLRLTYFKARKTETITKVRTITGTAATGSTLCRVGIYSVDGSGNLTLVASIANDTNLWIAANTAYESTLSASWSKVRGTTYAVGVLWVGSGTAPTFRGNNQLVASECGKDPRIGGLHSSLQSDLPASVAVDSIGDNAHISYVAMVP